jgi:hypothetical protein
LPEEIDISSVDAVHPIPDMGGGDRCAAVAGSPMSSIGIKWTSPYLLIQEARRARTLISTLVAYGTGEGEHERIFASPNTI